MEAALNSALGRTNLGTNPLRIGRSQDNQLVLSDPQSSSHHAEIALGPGGTNHQVTDLNSTNGTFVNEQRLQPHVPIMLKTGDVIRIGHTALTYETTSSFYDQTVAAGQPYGYEPTVMAPSSGQQAPPPMNPAPAHTNYPPQGYPQPGYPQPGYPQPGYPQPSYPPGMPVPQQKKKRTWLWIVLGVVGLLVIGCGVLAAIVLSLSTPEKTLAAACTAFKNEDAQGLYNLYSARAQAQPNNSVATIKKSFLLIDTVGGIGDCTYTNVQQNGSNATADVKITLKNGKPVPLAKTFLVNENGTWKLDTPPAGSGTSG